jgi:hypothetical protein
MGCQLLTKLNIQTRLQELQEKRSERTQITKDKVLRAQAAIAFLDVESV